MGKKSIATRGARYQLLACSDQDRDIAWMNDLDDEFGEVDCTDDYESEKKEVLGVGLTDKFEKSDWLMKALLGPVSKKFDAWDEAKRGAIASSQVSQKTKEEKSGAIASSQISQKTEEAESVAIASSQRSQKAKSFMSGCHFIGSLVVAVAGIAWFTLTRK